MKRTQALVAAVASVLLGVGGGAATAHLTHRDPDAGATQPLGGTPTPRDQGEARTAVPSEPRPDVSTDVRPGRLDRGRDAAVAYVDGDEIVDDGDRLRVPGQDVVLLGTRDDGYVVGVRRAGASQILVVRADGGTELLFSGINPADAVLSSDGRWLAYSSTVGNLTSVLVDDLDEIGRTVAERDLRGRQTLLAVDADAVVLRREGQGSTLWRWPANRVSTLTGTDAYAADLEADRIATFTKDPYLGGCSTVRAVSEPDRVLSRSCEQAVESFSPSGDRMTTTALLSDGVGPNQLTLSRTDGDVLARYDIAGGYVGRTLWETDDVPVLDAHSTGLSARVRCTTRACTLASDPSPSP